MKDDFIHEKVTKQANTSIPEQITSDDTPQDPFWKKPLVIIGALFLIFLLVLWVIPHYAIPLDPNPGRVPSLQEIVRPALNETGEAKNLTTSEAFNAFVDPTDPVVRQTATYIATQACASGEKVCHAKALYYFVRDNLDYISDPVNFEYVEEPKEILATGGGDCESGALLLASMMESIGINSQIVFVPKHAFIRIWLPEASSHYQKKGWVYLDWTCSTCGFGELPRSYTPEEISYLDVK